jgi:hypothetical protein
MMYEPKHTKAYTELANKHASSSLSIKHLLLSYVLMLYVDLDIGYIQVMFAGVQVYLAFVWCDVNVKGAWWQLHINYSSWLVLHLILTPHLHTEDVCMQVHQHNCTAEP